MTKKISDKQTWIRFVSEQRAFVKLLESRSFVAVPHLQIGHEKTLSEARSLLTKAEAKLG